MSAPNTLDWLLASDSSGARHLTLRDLFGDESGRVAAHREGPIAAVLDAMQPEGYWFKPGPGYSPKYKSTVWSLILLAQLGADRRADPRVAAACEYIMAHALDESGRFSMNATPSSNIDCLQGNLITALRDLGVEAERLLAAYEWLARSITGEGIAPATEKGAATRYSSANCGPGFACGYNGDQPCAWGAIKAALAFSRLPADQRSPLTGRAITQTAEFLLGTDPARAEYPTRDGARPSRHWWKFGFPVFYVADLLQNVAALIALGYGHDPRLAPALDVIRSKQDADGRWPLEHTYNTWVEVGALKQPNKWVTLRVLRAVGG